MEIDGAVLRHVRLGAFEIVEQIYTAVRDLSWNTIPSIMVEQSVESNADGFRARVVSRQRDLIETIKFAGRAGGSLHCDYRARATADGRYMRIGLNILHDGRTWSGARYTAGSAEGVLPERIAPVATSAGTDAPLIPAFRALRLEQRGLAVDFSFEGEAFEMEDQRNWADASFKTFAMPMARPAPFVLRSGEELRQRVRIAASGRPEARRRSRAIEIRAPAGPSMPAIGTMLSTGALGARQQQFLAGAGLSHLWCSLPIEADDLARLAGNADALVSPLVLACRASERRTLTDVVARLGKRVVGIVLVADPAPEGDMRSVGRAMTDAVRRQLARGADGPWVVSGTDGFFCALNRSAGVPLSRDGVAFTLSPTVHIADDTSVIANLAAVATVVGGARAIAGSRRVHVGPVTLATQFGPFALADGSPDAPRIVSDPRQAALAGAAIAVGLVGGIVAGGADAATLFAAAGPSGMMRSDVFPAYHVVADAAELAGAAVCPVDVPDPRIAAGFAAVRNTRFTAVIANLRPRRETLRIAGLPEGRASVRMLDVATFQEASTRPATFRRRAGRERVTGTFALSLDAYAIARIDLDMDRTMAGP